MSQCSISRLNSNTPFLSIESFLQKCGYRKETDVFTYSSKVPCYVHSSKYSLPNNQIRINYMIAVRLELRKHIL